MKVGMITQWSSPEPLPIFASLAKSLASRGHQVRIMTSYPNYPHDVDYGRPPSAHFHDRWEGLEMLRVSSSKKRVQGVLSRVRSYLGFAISTIRRRHFLADSDVIYVYASPITVAACAMALAATRKTPYVLHIQDLWPQSVTESGLIPSRWLNNVVGRIIAAAIKPLYRSAARIVVISPGMKKFLIRTGVAAEKISVILNWEAQDVPAERTSVPQRMGERVHCVYAGNIGVMQDIRTLVLAVAKVGDTVPVNISIYGSGLLRDDIKRLADELEIPNLIIHDRVSREKMDEVYRGSDFQLVTLLDREVFRYTIPSKFQTSLSKGIPVISNVPGDLQWICEHNRLGYTATPGSVDSLAAALTRAASSSTEERTEMARRCRQYYSEHLSMEQATRQMEIELRLAFQAGRVSVRQRPQCGTHGA